MDVFLDFLVNHYRVLILLVLNLIYFIILFCKKKVKIDDISKQVLMLIPEFINIAEVKFQDGAEKYSYVFNRCIELLHTLTHRSAASLTEEYTAFIDSAIENVLSTPQKKER